MSESTLPKEKELFQIFYKFADLELGIEIKNQLIK